MSQQDECEDDIWDYKPLRKKRKAGTGEGPATPGDGPSTSKKGKHVNNDSKTRKSVKNNDSNSSGKLSAVKRSKAVAVQVERDLTSGSVNISNGCAGEVSAGPSQPEGVGPGPPPPPPQCSGGDRWCPICQMPFSILVVQTQRWHVSECLDAPREDHEDKECPDGFQCTSTIPSHYRRYSHTLLAHSRASGDPVCLLERQTPAESSLGGLAAGPPASGSILDSSQDSAVSLSSQSNLSASPIGSDFPSTPMKVANGLLLLRSPGPKDFKKRKGWSSTSSKGSNKSTGSSQGSKTQVSSSTPKPPKAGGGSQASQDGFIKTDVSPEDAAVKTDFSTQGVVVNTDISPQETVIKTDFSPQGGFIKADFSPDGDDDEISYSPLSKFPEEEEEEVVRGSLPHNVTERESDNDSLMLFSDEELFGTFSDDLEAGTGEQGASPFPNNSQPKTQVDPGTLSEPGNRRPDSAAAAHLPSSSREENQTQGKAPSSSCLQSPQSKVLDRLRQTLSGSIEVPRGVLDEPASFPQQDLSSSQSSLQSQASQSVGMAPRLGQSKAGQATALKQTDIGVFFGLKPLKEKEEVEKAESAATHSSPSAESSSQRQGERRGRRGRSRAVASSGDPPSHSAGGDPPGTTGNSQATGAEGGVGRGGGRPAGRRRTEGGAGRGGGSPAGSRPEGGAGRGAGRGGRPAGKRKWSRWNRDGEPGDTRQCPFYKKIPGTKFAIDAFSYGEIEGISAYFLTHFHSDHYGGLKKRSTVPIYCNRITGNLVMSKLGVSEQYVHILPMNVQVTVDGVRVTLLDANHCPGSAMLLFMLPDGQTVLHTGDFRADPSMETYPEILSCRVQTLYLDTTYCSPEYTFPRQDKVISFAANTAFEAVTLAPRTLVVCGSYSVGKEKVFLALAEVLGTRVCLSQDKYNTMCCLESDHIRELITTDGKAAQVHVLPMMKISFKHLQDHLRRFSSQYDQLLAFKPTGWTFSQQADSVEDIRPQRSGNITIYGVPYSEHSSFVEMKRFVQWLQPLKVIPTVNVGSYASRRAMEKCFSEWLQEAKTRPHSV